MALKNIGNLKDCLIKRIVPTGAILPDQWLCIEVVEQGLTLYVADVNAHEAQRLWPHVELFEINNAGPEDLPYTKCVN